MWIYVFIEPIIVTIVYIIVLYKVVYATDRFVETNDASDGGLQSSRSSKLHPSSSCSNKHSITWPLHKLQIIRCLFVIHSATKLAFMIIIPIHWDHLWLLRLNKLRLGMLVWSYQWRPKQDIMREREIKSWNLQRKQILNKNTRKSAKHNNL